MLSPTCGPSRQEGDSGSGGTRRPALQYRSLTPAAQQSTVAAAEQNRRFTLGRQGTRLAPSRRSLRLLMRFPVRLEAPLPAVGVFGGVGPRPQTADALDRRRLAAALASRITFISHRVWHPAAAVGSRSDASCSSNAHHSSPKGQLALPRFTLLPQFKWLCRPLRGSAGAELLPSCFLRPCDAVAPQGRSQWCAA